MSVLLSSKVFNFRNNGCNQSVAKRNTVYFKNTKRSFSTAKKRIVVVGGGAGGLSIANSKIREGYDITLIEPSEDHFYQPFWTLVGGGIRNIECSRRKNKDLIDNRINWVQNKASTFDPENNAVTTEDGKKFEYDALVVATGLGVYFDRIKGLSETIGRNGVCSNYSFQYAPKTWEFLSTSKGGNYVFTFPPTVVKCAGAPQKIMYLADSYLRDKNLRSSSNVSFYSAIGELFAVKHYSDALNDICDKRDLARNFGHNLIEVDGEKKIAKFQKVKAIAGSEEIVEVPFDFLHVTPHMGPLEFLKSSPIVNSDGWVDVHKYTLQHNKYPNVFALGDCASLPTSKTAAAITSQSSVLKRNIDLFFQNKELTAKYDGYTSCPIPTGHGKLVLAEFDYDKNTRETFSGYIDQRKESRFLYLFKEHLFPILYWNYLLTGLWEGPHNILPFVKNYLQCIFRR